MMRFVLVVLVLCLVIIAPLQGAAICPAKTAFVAWEPFYWHPDLNGRNSDIVEKYIAISNTHREHQGYTFKRYRGGVLGDDNQFVLGRSGIGECTNLAFGNIQNDAGVLMIDTHGNIGFIDGVTGPRFEVDADELVPPGEIHQWAGGNNNMVIGKRLEDRDNCWIVKVHSAWFKLMYQATLNANQAIVCVFACHSAEGGNDSVVNACGGRLRMGYIGSPAVEHAKNDIDTIFGRMSGILPNDEIATQGTLRVSTLAYTTPKNSEKAYTDIELKINNTKRRSSPIDNAGEPGVDGPLKFIVLEANDNKPTTLCPAVALTLTMRKAMREDLPPEPESAVAKVFPKPAAQNAARAGNGYVEFDTECDTTTPAQEVLVVHPRSYVTLANVRWVGKSRIEFAYSAPCEGAVVGLIVKATKLRGEAGVLYLDGNEDPATAGNGNPAPPSSGGVAPSGDDFSWIFTTN